MELIIIRGRNTSRYLTTLFLNSIAGVLLHRNLWQLIYIQILNGHFVTHSFLLYSLYLQRRLTKILSTNSNIKFKPKVNFFLKSHRQFLSHFKLHYLVQIVQPCWSWGLQIWTSYLFEVCFKYFNTGLQHEIGMFILNYIMTFANYLKTSSYLQS